MTLREFFFENFAGDLEYHPRRAVLYLGLAVAALCFWIFSPQEAKFSALPLVFVLGSVTLLLKAFSFSGNHRKDLGLLHQNSLISPIHPIARLSRLSLTKPPRSFRISVRVRFSYGPF